MTGAEAGEDIVFARSGQVVFKLTRVDKSQPRQFGGMSFVVPDDFDEPPSDEELAAWE